MRAIVAHWTLPDVRRFLFEARRCPPGEVTDTIGGSVRDFAAAGYGIWLILEPAQPGLAGTAGIRPLEYLGLEIFFGRGRQAARHDPVRRRARPHDPLPQNGVTGAFPRLTSLPAHFAARARAVAVRHRGTPI
jgi:hypothetical protein